MIILLLKALVKGVISFAVIVCIGVCLTKLFSLSGLPTDGMAGSLIGVLSVCFGTVTFALLTYCEEQLFD